MESIKRLMKNFPIKHFSIEAIQPNELSNLLQRSDGKEGIC